MTGRFYRIAASMNGSVVARLELGLSKGEEWQCDCGQQRAIGEPCNHSMGDDYSGEVVVDASESGHMHMVFPH